MSITFVLASQSPRRRFLLGHLDAHVVTQVSGANEDTLAGQDPVDYVADVVRRKAEAVAALPRPLDSEHVLVIAADTTVVIDSQILGKPASTGEARSMLQQLRDRQHLVHTGMCVIDTTSSQEVVEIHTAIVTMRNYSDAEIDAYIATGDPLDKAGAYGIQHPVFRPVSRLDGCFLGVMGLSLCHLLDVLRRCGAPGTIDPLVLGDLHEGYHCPLQAKLQSYER